MDLVGKVIEDRYEILEEIGKGGNACVYKAHCKMLDRNVAIKVLRDEFENDKEFVKRFNTEAQAAARLSNPHIVSVYDVGCDNGIHYIVMEFVEGETLKKYIDKKGALPWREAAGYIAQICDGLQEAHKNNIVHRDIKPQNIIMTTDGVLKVTDFGIARANTQSTLTAGKNAIGTVHYLSPEQARGGYTDERTDVYSLGVVFYELLTGKLPFEDESPVAIAVKHLQEQAIKPTEIVDGIPKTVEQIVLKMMEKDQMERYANIGDIIKDLRHVLDNPDVPLDNISSLLDDDGDRTIKMPAVDKKAIHDYEKSLKKNKDKEQEDNSSEEEKVDKIRNINEQRALRAQKKKERRLTAIAIAAAVAVIVGLSVLFINITGGGFGVFSGNKDTVEIPSLVGMTIDEARDEYKDQFSIIVSERVPSSEKPGTILEQDLKAGTKREKRDDLVIKVTVSTDQQSITVEDCTGMDLREAKEKLELAGFKVSVTEKKGEKGEPDKVLSQEPKGGTKAIFGDLVILYVSRNTELEATSAPDETGDDDEDKPSNNEKPEATQKPTSNNSDNNSDNGNNNSGNGADTNNGGNTNTGGNSNSGDGSGLID